MRLLHQVIVVTLNRLNCPFLMNYNQKFVGIFHRYPTLFWDIKRGASIKFLDSVCGFLITDVHILVTWPYLNYGEA